MLARRLVALLVLFVAVIHGRACMPDTPVITWQPIIHSASSGDNAALEAVPALLNADTAGSNDDEVPQDQPACHLDLIAADDTVSGAQMHRMNDACSPPADGPRTWHGERVRPPR